jgi:myosin heavy subunit
MDFTTAYMSPVEFAQSVQTAKLELAYERALRQADRIYEEERVRAMRVQLLLLEHANDDLQKEAEKDEDEQIHLMDTNEELRAHLAELEVDFQQTQMDLKARVRELDHLRTEVNALNAASSDSTKLLKEKLALERELNNMKPEVEHLRSQASSGQKLLSEKLALERELSSLQVELETEKRAVQRIRTREESSSRDEVSVTELERLRKDLVKAQRDAQKSASAQEQSANEIERLQQDLAKAQREAQKTASNADSASIAEVEALRKDLAKAQREAQKADRESRKKTTEWEDEKEKLEGKLDAFRNKLRTTKEQLHQAQEEIEKLQASKMALSAEMTKARINGGATTANPRKRNIARFDPDMTIGTPGNGGPAKKARASVSVGEKSTFSMTPFLNRTLSILPESPDDVEGEKSKAAEAEESRSQAAKPKMTRPQQDKPAPVKKAPKALGETNKSKTNTTVPKTQLDKLIEESDSESEPDQSAAADKENTSTTTTSTTNKSADSADIPSKPKRTNIFDEENSAPAPRIRTLGGTGGSLLGRNNLKAKSVGRGKMLAEFSPLKKDRRGHASVLAS